MVLIDTNKNKAEGEAMDLSHAIPYSNKYMKIHAGEYKDLADCSIIIITAGAGQKPNETRLQLVHRNVEIFKSIIPNIIEHNKDCILLVVSNPVDILTYVTWKLSGFPTNKVIGSGTVLDTARLKYLLGQELSVDSRSVHAFIIGEHGDSELAVFSSANISGLNLNEYCSIAGKCDKQKRQELYEEVRDCAYKIIEKKGATYYGIAKATKRIAECIVRNEHSILPISCYVDSHYGVKDMFIGVPAKLGITGVEDVIDIPLDEDEQHAFESSANMLKSVIDSLDV